MITANEVHVNTINSPVRHIPARIEVLDANNAAVCDLLTCHDRLISFSIERVGEGKFYGYGICNRLNVHLIDTNRTLDINTSNIIEVVMGADSDYLYPFPPFKVSEVHRDENTNELSITAYDALYQAAAHTANELPNTAYSLETVAADCAALIGLNLLLELPEYDTAFAVYYPEGANLDGTESIRSVLDGIAEATQTIYYVNNQYELVFKRLDMEGEAVYTIDREKYFTLDSKTNRRLKRISSVTELGDNIFAEITENGSTQYLRDNPFLDIREDIGQLLIDAIGRVGGMTINQFELEWRGNYLLEIGDKIAMIDKENQTVISYLLDDVISYDGSYSHTTRWAYADDEAETDSNPATLGDALKQTYARVDKANREIAIVASQAEENAEALAAIRIDTGSITTTVSSIEKVTTDAFGTVNGEIADLKKQTEQIITPEEIKLTISQELSNGVDKVRTATGFTFDDEGLTISKEDAELSTTISEDGMQIFRNSEAILTANNVGVDAANLHATTYLIIGTNSRLEDYGSNRTGCFWIGEV